MTLKEFMDKLGVGYVLHAYETYPWSHYDPESETTVNADIAVNSDGDEVEAQILYIKDNPKEDEQALNLVLWLRLVPYTGEQWKMADLKIKGEDHKNKTYDWEANACDVFRICTQKIQNGEIPDFDEIVKEEFFKGSQGGQRGGRGGGKKSPKINPEQMPGLGRKN